MDKIQIYKITDRIASNCIATSYLFQKNGDSNFVYFDTQGYPLYSVDKAYDDKFFLKKFRKFNDCVRELLKWKPEESYEFLQDHNWLCAYSLDYFKRACGNGDAVKLLKSYKKNFGNFIDRNMTSMNTIEMTLFYESSGLVTRRELAKELVNKFTVTMGDFEKYYGSLEEVEDGASNDIKVFTYNNWKIYFTDKAKSKDDIVELLKTVESVLSGVFSELCYGRVEVKNSLGVSTKTAEYDIPSDSLRVKNRKEDASMVKSVIHELGHRIWYKQLSQSQKSNIREMYNEVKTGQVKIKLEKGDTVEFKDSWTVEVKDKSYKGTLVKIVDMKKADRKYKIGDNIVLNTDTFYPQSIQTINGKQIDSEKISAPTRYSLENAEEFFSECFAFLVLGNLNTKLSSWLKDVLKS